MGKIGILAFGSIINNPDKEIEAATESKINDIITDFKIEFARTSSTRKKAPTLAVVCDGGSFVKGTLIILKENIELGEAKNILLRRECDKVGDKSTIYTGPKNWMEIKESRAYDGCETIIYASMTQNITNPTAKKLAEFAIKSTEEKPHKNGTRSDGIQYLYDIKAMGITTPLMKEYEEEILIQLRVDSLEMALEKTK